MTHTANDFDPQPNDAKREAVEKACDLADEALAPYGAKVDREAMSDRYGVDVREPAPHSVGPSQARIPAHFSDLIAARLAEVIGSESVSTLGVVSTGEAGLRELNAFALGVEWSNDNEVSTKAVRLLLVEIANVRQALLNEVQKAAPPAAAPASSPSVEFLVEDLLVRWCPCPKHTRKREQKGNPS